MNKLRLRSSILLVFLILLMSGCAATNIPFHQIVSVHPSGSASDPACYSASLPDSLWIIHLDTILKGVRSAIKSDKKRVYIYVHGGLFSPQMAEECAAEFGDTMGEDGFPIFINWRSGFFTCYGEHLFRTRQGRQWYLIGGVLSSPFILVTNLARGISRLPMIDFELAGNFLETTRRFIRLDKSLTRFSAPDANADNLQFKFDTVGTKTQFGELPVLINNRPNWSRWNLFFSYYPTLVSIATLPLVFDQFGTGSWDIMKRRTETMFIKPRPPSMSILTEVPLYENSNMRKGVVFQLMDSLQAIQTANPDLEIYLMGHSMGTMVCNKILTGWPDLEISKIIYMAAACQISEFQKCVVPYMRNHKETQFYNFMLHPIVETLEFHVGGLGGTGSLLHQIDQFYENIVADNGRTLGKWENVTSGINYFRDSGVSQRIFLRAMPIAKGFPMNHSDFKDGKFVKTAGKFWEPEKFGLLRE